MRAIYFNVTWIDSHFGPKNIYLIKQAKFTPHISNPIKIGKLYKNKLCSITAHESRLERIR